MSEKDLKLKIEKLENDFYPEIKGLKEDYAKEFSELKKQIAELREYVEAIDKSQADHYTNLNERFDNYKIINNQSITELKEQIAELGDKLQKCGVKWDFRLDEQWGFITEFKEEMKIFKGAVINYNHDYDRIRQVRELLRELMKSERRVHDIGDSDYTFNEHVKRIDELLEKLDSPKKIAIEPELMERIMSHKSVPMDKSKLKTEKKELYELFKNGDEFNFKRTTHPFTEYNNMVHRGIGMKLMPYDTEEKLIEKFIKEDINPFIELYKIAPKSEEYLYWENKKNKWEKING